MKKKVLFVTNFFPKKDGIQDAIFLFWRAKQLISRGHTVTVLKWNQELKDVFNCPYNLSDLNEHLLDESIDVFPVHHIQLLNPMFRNKLYKKIKENYDIVHFHWLWSMTVFPSIKKWGIPFVVTCHGSDIYRMGEAGNKLAIGRWINKKVMARQMQRLNAADHVIFVSKHIQNAAIEKGAVALKHSVVPNGINTNFKMPKEERLKVIVGFVGNLIPIKGADKLPEIIQKIVQKKDDIEFVIIGDGHLRKKIKAQCQKYSDNVLFTKKISQIDVAKYMKKMTVLMVPSRSESFGCVIKEAQACGVAVVGSSNGGIPEVIGKGGVIVEGGAQFEDRFADAVVKLIKHPIPTETLVDCAKGYTWENVVKQELGVYQKVLETYADRR
jgi:teichuronic acid biosynthesis glycosyltransferase TuaC